MQRNRKQEHCSFSQLAFVSFSFIGEHMKVRYCFIQHKQKQRSYPESDNGGYKRKRSH